jgi:hypothetical protein
MRDEASDFMSTELSRRIERPQLSLGRSPLPLPPPPTPGGSGNGKRGESARAREPRDRRAHPNQRITVLAHPLAPIKFHDHDASGQSGRKPESASTKAFG